MCGNCDFETSTCGFYDKSSGRFLWSRVQEPTNNTDQGPQTDHTYINDTNTKGNMMLTQLSTSSGSSSSRSDLWGPVVGRTSENCKISMWVHMKHTGSRMSLYFTNSTYIYNYKFLLTIYGFGNDYWQKFLINVGAYPPKYQLEINAYPYYSNNFNYSDIGIDDVTFEDCSAKQILLDKSIDCNFDQSMCFYTNDISPDSLVKWERRANQSSSLTGPSSDHTSGFGYYTIFYTTFSLTDGKAGRLSSTVQTTLSNQYLCFEFWYLMFGATVFIKQRVFLLLNFLL